MTLKRFLRVTLGIGLLASGVALAADEPAIAVRLPRTTFNMKLGGTDIVAPHVQLTRGKNELRGRVGDATVAFKVEGDKLTGNIGGAAVNLKAQVEGDTLKGKGGFGGSPSEVRLSPSELYVYVNQCTYRMKVAEGRYVGKRSCDLALQPPTEVTIPEAFQQYSPVERVALLLLALG
jgi:hypothetical protein